MLGLRAFSSEARSWPDLKSNVTGLYTLVAITSSSRRPVSRTSLPTSFSASPAEYVSAVSMKLMPSSIARWKSGRASASPSTHGRHCGAPMLIMPRHEARDLDAGAAQPREAHQGLNGRALVVLARGLLERGEDRALLHEALEQPLEHQHAVAAADDVRDGRCR